MNSDKINLALEKFTNRFDTINTMILQDIGRYIKKFEGLIPSQAYKVAQQLKYGQSIEKIEAELKKASNLTSSEIHDLLEQTAKDNIAFANTYYQYRNLSPVNYEENEVFQELVSAAEEVGKKSVENLSKTTAFKLIDDKGEPLYLDVEDTYNEVIDRCALAITSGELDYNTAINSTIKQLAASGIKKVYYDNDNKRAYMRRLDSSVRMNVLEAVSQLNMKMQEQFARDFGADGVEISAHTPCAPDHQDIQGKQYSQEDFQILNDNLQRKIGTLNCTHYAFSIVLGVNQPQYSDEELRQMKEDSNKKISFQGREYTKYQATQVQRQLETKLRYLRDEKNILKIAGSNEDKALINKKISQTMSLYKDFSDSAGLETRMERTKSYLSSIKNTSNTNSETNVPKYEMYDVKRNRQNVTEEELYKLFNEEQEKIDKYSDIESKWSGKINIVDDVSPAKEWDCSITINSNSLPQEIRHELLHARSISYFDKETYIKYQYEEEATVEMFNKQLLLKSGMEYYDNVYFNIVNCLEQISDIMNIDRYEFAKNLFDVAIPEREKYLLNLFKNKPREKELIDLMKEAFAKWEK